MTVATNQQHAIVELWHVMTEAAEERNFDQLLEGLLQTACALSNAQIGTLYLLDASNRYLIAQAYLDERVDDNLPLGIKKNQQREQKQNIPLYIDDKQNNKSPIAFSAFTGEKTLIDNANVIGSFDFNRQINTSGVHSHESLSLMVWPIKRMDSCITGVLELMNTYNAADHQKSSNAIFQELDQALMSAFVAKAAVIINNFQLEQKNQQLVQVLYETNQNLLQENKHLKEQVVARAQSSDMVGRDRLGQNIVGRSLAMTQVFELIEKVADTSTTILIRGETGVGKELVAQAIHHNSQRRDKPFIALNCAALPENLLESELFGYEKGAFTGATSSKKGLFEQADNGTLFLDEIGDLPLPLQAKLLRVLQEGEVRPLGGTQVIQVNARVLAATHHDIKVLVERNEFREDLYYRLNVFPITLPPLRERKEDLPALIERFIQTYNHTHGRQVKGVLPELLNTLMSYHFPGNIRELRNIIERAVLLAKPSAYLSVKELPEEIAQLAKPKRPLFAKAFSSGLGLNEELGLKEESGLKEKLEQVEAKLIKQCLKHCEGNQTKTAEKLKISRRALIDKIKKYGLAEDACGVG